MKKKISLAVLLCFTASLVMAQGKTVVFPFENQSKDSKIAWLGYGLEILLEDSLDGIPLADRMNAVDSMDVPDISTLTLATRLIIARKLGADTLLTGNFSVSKDEISLHFTRYEISKWLKKAGECTVSMKGFPDNLSHFIQGEIGGKYPYPDTFSGHQFEVYVRGMLRAVANNDFEEIMKLAGKVTKCEPLNRNLGNLLYTSGEFEDALTYLKRLPESDIDGLFHSGMCCVKLENYADGLIYFLQTLKSGRNIASVVNAAGCLVALKHPAEAATFLGTISGDGEGEEPVVLFNRAVVEAGQEKWSDALNMLSRYVSSFRITDEAKQLAAFCCEKCNCTHPLCSESSEKKSENQESIEPVSFYQFSEGEDGTSEAVDLKEIKELYLAKAAQAIQSGSKKEAIDALQKILYLDPLQKEALRMLCEQCDDKSACKKLATLEPAD